MAAQDYVFDPTGSAPENKVEGEVHSLTHSAGVIPLQGAFYRDGLVVLATREVNGNQLVEELVADRDFYFSPLYVRPAAVTGKEVHSFIVVKRKWDSVRLDYQNCGGEYGEDEALLTKLTQTQFDRTIPSEWLKITNAESYHPRTRDPVMGKASEIEIFNEGMHRIQEALLRLTPGQGEKATNQQVTELEVRQTELETSQEQIEIEFSQIQLDFFDLREFFYYLLSLFQNGREGNYTENGGHVYVSDGPLTVHHIPHGLDTLDVDVTIWAWDEDDEIYRHTTLVRTRLLDSDNIDIISISPVKLLVIVRPVTVDTGGYLFQSLDPDTVHVIDHNLNSGFLSVTCWVEQDNGQWEFALFPLKTMGPNRLFIELDEPRQIRGVVQRPLPNAYIYKSESAQFEHVVEHELLSSHVGVMVWIQDDDGHFKTGLPATTLTSNNRLTINVDQPRVIKVVVQPALVKDPTFEQEYNQRLTSLEDRQDQLQVMMVYLENLVTNIANSVPGGIDPYLYESQTPQSVYTLTHNLNSYFIDPTLWIQRQDGFYYRDNAPVRIIDKDTISISLLNPRNIRISVKPK